MRLTLRTLLAYLDDVLDPADKEELSQKIESSEFAEDLVHRTRDTMRRLRLSAPQVIGTGMGLDPNTVAEYLDNVLPPEQVGDFERICLESDVHLAEAAACHHVLTMVLGEPADVEPRARQRMYDIPNESRERRRVRVEPAHGASARPQAAAVPAPPTAQEPADPMEIPEYLRAGSLWQSRGVLAALAAVMLVGTTLYLASGLRGWFGAPAEMAALTDQTVTPKGDDEVSNAKPAPSTPLGPPPQPATPGITPPSVSVPDSADPYAIADQDATAVDTPDTPQTQDEAAAAAPPVGVDQPPNTTQPQGEFDADSAAAIDEETDRYARPAAEPSTEIRPSTIAPPPTETPPIDIPNAPDTIATNGTADAAEEATAVDTANDVPAGPSELGTYLGGKTVLLRYDDEARAWYRMQPRDGVFAGQRLVALPEFRPTVTLLPGTLMDLSGGTQVVLESGEELQADGLPDVGPAVPAVEIVYGRLVFINTSMTENELRLKLGPAVGDARLGRHATLAVEVKPQYVPGNDPRETPSPVVVRFLAPEGGVTWRDAAGEKTAEAAASWALGDGATSDLATDASLPEWIDHEPRAQSSEHRFGAPVVESTLASDRPVDVQFLAMFQGSAPRREVKSLVTRSSIHVGLFEPFVDALRDSEQRANWKSHIETLRSAMALSPQSAENVWRALVAQRGEQAATDLYEMLCGYSADQVGRTPEQRKTGPLARLVGWLEEESLDYRVLAVHDLAEITGKRLMSNPAAGAAERTRNVRQWRMRLEADELRPVEE